MLPCLVDLNMHMVLFFVLCTVILLLFLMKSFRLFTRTILQGCFTATGAIQLVLLRLHTWHIFQRHPYKQYLRQNVDHLLCWISTQWPFKIRVPRLKKIFPQKAQIERPFSSTVHAEIVHDSGRCEVTWSVRAMWITCCFCDVLDKNIYIFWNHKWLNCYLLRLKLCQYKNM